MSGTPYPAPRLPGPAAIVLGLTIVLGLAAAAPATGQSEDPEQGFRRQYLDVEAYRTNTSTLRGWPSLSRLVRWSRELERAVAEDDQILSGELLAEFRGRVDSLSAEPLPAFMEPSADSVAATLDSLESHLQRAEAWLGALPPAPEPTDGEAPNEEGRQRTLVTGRTAVTVPAGVRVGPEDSLPTAELPGEEENFVDLVNLALADLDRLVHLTRTAGRPISREGASGPAEAPEPRRSAGTERPRPGP